MVRLQQNLDLISLRHAEHPLAPPPDNRPVNREGSTARGCPQNGAEFPELTWAPGWPAQNSNGGAQLVTVSSKSQQIELVLFAVTDTGIGIAPEHHQTIFKEFSQVENPLQEKYRGTG
jgi:Histidine kinase-, DNA gyrase B-, and HSP90-like ATPase